MKIGVECRDWGFSNFLSVLAFQGFHQRLQTAVDRGGDAQAFALAHHMAVEVVDLARFAARQVLRGGGALRGHRARNGLPLLRRASQSSERC